MHDWMVHDTMQCINLYILASQPPVMRSKNMVLEFITNFEPANRHVWIRGDFYQVTPTIIAQALRCESHLPGDKQLCKD